MRQFVKAIQGSETFEREGFVVVPNLLDAWGCNRSVDAIGEPYGSGAGSRTMLELGWCAALAESLKGCASLRQLLAIDAVAVQCTLFDKSPSKNWLVGLHQDLSIPVARRVESAECSGWSTKEGQVYVQPSVSVIEQLVAVRVHLDDCPVDAGALRVVPGSHAFGRLDTTGMERLRLERGELVVPVPRGAALVMRPLLLHASSKATVSVSRRVLHFVFGPRSLPCGLEWPESVAQADA